MNLDPTQERAKDVAAALATFERAGAPTLGKIRYTHEAMIDLIVADPSIAQNTLAAHFGYSAAWISVVINTDMFQAKLAQRREEIVNPLIRASLEERFAAITQRSLEVLQEKLSQSSDKIPDNLALRAAELGAKAKGVGGFGNVASAQAPVHVDVNVRLDNLASRLTGLLATKRTEVIDV